ncbi:MAG: hypothetical protein GC190_02905 [Alphaproteobacteria bacterium]|nr:hypothetical protein [Alphaproteobacteria bacterium]
MEELVEGWIALNNAREDEPAYRSLSWAFDAASDLCYGYPELAFEFVLAVLAKHISEETFFVLAAGPLEDLLANNGAAIIDRVEVQARLDTRFQELLGGVWRNKMSEDIWQRVQRAASPAC